MLYGTAWMQSALESQLAKEAMGVKPHCKLKAFLEALLVPFWALTNIGVIMWWWWDHNIMYPTLARMAHDSSLSLACPLLQSVNSQVHNTLVQTSITGSPQQCSRQCNFLKEDIKPGLSPLTLNYQDLQRSWAACWRTLPQADILYIYFCFTLIVMNIWKIYSPRTIWDLVQTEPNWCKWFTLVLVSVWEILVGTKPSGFQFGQNWLKLDQTELPQH